MIAILTGKVIEKEDKALILDVQGIGYRVAALASVRDEVGLGEEVTLRIHHHMTSEAESLYGFMTKEELQVYELLLSVPSVGPKTAMSILEIAPAPVLEQAVAENDTTLLTKVSGVGKRTAERIIVELRERIQTSTKHKAPTGSVQHEAVEALISIGFSPTQAREKVSSLPKNVGSVEEAVKAALRQAS